MQDTSQVSKKKSTDQSQKLKGIELIFDAAQFEIDTQKAIKANKRETDSSINLVAQVKELVFHQRFQMSQQGSTDDETFLFDDKDEKVEDILWVSTDEDKSDDDDDENESIDIKTTDDEKTDTNVEDQDEEQKADEEVKANEEQLGDNQAGDEQVGDDVSKFIKVKQELAAKEKMPKYSTTPYDQAAEDEHKQKEILFQMMMVSKSHEKHPSHKALYDALIQYLLVDENDMDRLVVHPASKRKRQHDNKDPDPSTGSHQGMKKRRTEKAAEPSKKSLKSKESAKEEPNLDNVANDADEPQANAIPQIPKKDWFNKSPRPEILDLD
ncbi:hypothetical protein Tco_0545601 [Tanacetum coccineum]